MDAVEVHEDEAEGEGELAGAYAVEEVEEPVIQEGEESGVVLVDSAA